MVVYGESKVGKTVDLLYSVPNGIIFTPAPRGLEAWRRLTQVKPNERRINRVSEAIAIIKKEKPPAVGFDDFSIALQREQFALEAKGLTGWKLWGAIKGIVNALRETILDLGAVCILNLHENHPRYEGEGLFKTRVSRGGPLMPTKALSAWIPHVSPLVVRAINKPPGVADWPGMYSCDPSDADWITGDRWCSTPPSSPLNIREVLLRARGVDPTVVVPPRAPGLAVLDKMAEGVCKGRLTGAFATDEAAAAGLTSMFPKQKPSVLRWAWRDGCARAALERSADHLFAMFTHTPDAAPGSAWGSSSARPNQTPAA